MPRARNAAGLPVYVWTDAPAIVRRSSQQSRGEWWWVVRLPTVDWVMCSYPWAGTWVTAVYDRRGGTSARIWTSPIPIEDRRMRRLATTTGITIVPQLSGASKVYAKCTRVMEFLCATAYDDGSARRPGYITLRNRGHCYEITAYDPDSGLRLPVSGPDVDHVYGALDTLLGVADAPWQVDDYLMSQLSKKRKK